jgi:carbon starvation protein
VWLLLQPRGALGGYFLYVIMVVGVLGIVIGALNGSLAIRAPAFGAGNFFTFSGNTAPMFPVLFITIACGACSGFHSIVASGTTSKQLDKETDARAIGYGGMLLESFLACISLATVMILAKPTGRPDLTYADGIAIFMNQVSFGAIPVDIARQFGLLCFATFVFDTLDACTRLARFVLMEFTGWQSRLSLYATTLVSVAVPALVLTLPPALVDGVEQPLWKIFWNLFGSSNQLLAALALLAITVWLVRRGRTPWLTLGPTLFMLVMTVWSLGLTLQQYLGRLLAHKAVTVHHLEGLVALVLVGMALWLVVEAILLVRRPVASPAAPEPQLA